MSGIDLDPGFFDLLDRTVAAPTAKEVPPPPELLAFFAYHGLLLFGPGG